MLANTNYQLGHRQFGSDVSFKALAPAPLSAPIESVQKTIEGTVDGFVKSIDEEKKKKSTKKAITVASSVIVVSALVALLNPKYSSKLVSKLKTLQESTARQVDKNKESFLKSKFYELSNNFLHWSERTIGFTGNANTVKDLWFKEFCTEEKKFLGVENKKTRNFLLKCDKFIRKILKKPHEKITGWFDVLGKKTVKNDYKSAMNKMHELDDLILQQKSKLSASERLMLESKLRRIENVREYFLENNLADRFKNQESVMENIERDFWKKYKAYKNGFANKWKNTGRHIDKNLVFWPEEILQPQRDKLEQSGLKEVEKLFNNSAENRGLYDEVLEIIKPHLSAGEAEKLNKTLNKAGEKLRKANYTENVAYFDKKRDLILGGAPTDIVTGLAGLGLSGLAIGTADGKEEKFSKTLTLGIPAVVGIGTSLAMTAMLFSGVKGMLIGGAASIGVSKIASWIDHHIFGNEDEIEGEDKDLLANKFKNAEVNNV